VLYYLYSILTPALTPINMKIVSTTRTVYPLMFLLVSLLFYYNKLSLLSDIYTVSPIDKYGYVI